MPTQRRPSLFLTLPYQQIVWGSIRSCKKTEPGHLSPDDQKDIPCHRILCSSFETGIKNRWGREGLDDIQSDVICLPKKTLYVMLSWKWLNICMLMALLSWKWLNICMLMETTEWIPYFAFPSHKAFALPIKFFLSQPTNVLRFYLFDSLLGSEWVSSCVGFSCPTGAKA